MFPMKFDENKKENFSEEENLLQPLETFCLEEQYLFDILNNFFT